MQHSTETSRTAWPALMTFADGRAVQTAADWAARQDRHLIAVTGIVSEGWNNTEGQCLAWQGSRRVWELLGQADHTRMIVHLDDHAILPEDLRQILDYCDAAFHGEPLPEDLRGEFFLQANRDRLDPAFGIL